MSLRVIAERLLTAPEHAADLRANWTPDGGAVVFERLEDGERRLYCAEVASGEVRPLPAPVNRPGTNSTGRPCWIGGELFFVSDRGGHEAVYAWDGAAGLRRVTPPGVTAYGPAGWAAGDTLLHFRQEPGPGAGEVQVWACAPDGSAARCLTASPGRHDQPWPLQGGRAFVCHARTPDGNNRVQVQDLESGAARPLTPAGDEAYMTPFPSPDGRWVAYAARAEGLPQIHLVGQGGSAPQVLTGGPQPHLFPAWSPDGRTLLAVRGDPVHAAKPWGQLVLLTLAEA